MIKVKNEYFVIGLMSGTSMDGLDVSFAKYFYYNDLWSFDLICAETFSYNQSIKNNFFNAFNNKISIDKIDKYFSSFISDRISEFIEKHSLQVDLVASHGHTIFHEPHNGFTTQIGNGKLISESLNLSVVSNFRQQDIDLGGQGAPLVPIGDRMLFSNYDACVNMGGIANISYDLKGERLGYDICPCNMIMNFLSQKIGKDFDYNGMIAQSGTINNDLLHDFNQIDYYKFDPPKSLGKEYIDMNFLSILSKSKIKIEDQLATFVEHVAIMISSKLNSLKISNCLFTGGGVFNNFLISRIKIYSKVSVIIPTNDLVNYKESIVFGLLGLLRMLNKKNCLASYTGASQDHSSGDIYLV